MFKVLVICLAATLLPLGAPAMQVEMPSVTAGQTDAPADMLPQGIGGNGAFFSPSEEPVSPFTVVSPTPVFTAPPTPAPTRAPGRPAYAFRDKGELMEVQRKLALAGYYGGALTASTAATGEMDEPTQNAIRAYLSVLRGDPKWTRSYLTEAEYRLFKAVGNRIATPTPNPQESSFTPNPTAIILKDTKPEDAWTTEDGDVAMPTVAPMGVFTHGAYEELAPPQPPPPTPVPTATLAPTPSPTVQPTPVPIGFSDIRYSRKRADELFVHGQVSVPGETVVLTDVAGQTLSSATADSTGAFTLHITGVKTTGQQEKDTLYLEVKAQPGNRVPLVVSGVEQQTLFAFTRSLDNTDLLVVAAVLLGLSAAMLALFGISKKSKKTPGAAGHNNPQGGSAT